MYFTIMAPDFPAVAEAGIGIARIGASAQRQRRSLIENVSLDNVPATDATTRFYAERGYRRITMIAGMVGPQGNPVRQNLQALKPTRLAPPLVNHGDFDEEGGYCVAKDILAARQTLTTIFAANDPMAIGVIRARYPEISVDIAVMVFEDIFVASVDTPGWSTINQFQETLARAAAEMVLKRLNDLRATCQGDIVKCRSISS